MATTVPATTAAQSSDAAKTVDASLWWEPFNVHLTELENASMSSEIPQNLVENCDITLQLLQLASIVNILIGNAECVVFALLILRICAIGRVTGEEVEGQSRVVFRDCFAIQAAQSEIERSIGFTTCESWPARVEYTAQIERRCAED